MIKYKYAFLFALICVSIEVGGWDMVYEPDGDLNLNDLVKTFNYDGIESHYITTEDGYVLNVERIKRDGADTLKPIIFVHGMTACSKSFFANKKKSPPIVFADNGYDVWLMNSRGTQNSQNHTTWNARTDREYWLFSWQEIGLIDLPNTIDLVLQHNVHSKVVLVGHSEGSAVIFVTLADRPEYNSKVALSIHWGVSVYHKGCSTVRLLGAFCTMEPLLAKIADAIGLFSLMPNFDIRDAARDICRYTIFKKACSEGAKFFLQSDEQIGHVKDWSFSLNLVMCGGSTRELFHFMQVSNSGRFARYDYGPRKNFKVYNSTESPLFHLEKVASPVVLWCGNNDIFCTTSDMQKLVSQLSNVASTNFKGKSSFTHFDFIISKDLHENMFGDLFQLLNKYNP